MLSFKPTFSVSSFTFIKRLLSSSSLSAIRVVSSAYLRLLICLPAILIPACTSSSPLQGFNCNGPTFSEHLLSPRTGDYGNTKISKKILPISSSQPSIWEPDENRKKKDISEFSLQSCNKPPSKKPNLFFRKTEICSNVKPKAVGLRLGQSAKETSLVILGVPSLKWQSTTPPL